ncbi:LysE family translocator [Paracoccus pacificus]|uniref:LysE family translocator n=1 Tax=Paracoccus pacificus TaxID=1463598 RepID=A0ABW4R6W3_9RHOB
MNWNLFVALTGFAFVTSVTPGPNNMMLMASGANFGLRRTVPHLLGVALGFGAMVAVLGLGVDRLFAAMPALGQALMWVSLAYMLWLAWKLAHANAPGTAEASATPLTFMQAAAFQWVNPKAWAMALGALSAYAAGAGGALIVALVFTAINLPSVLIWVVAGQSVRRWLTNPKRLQIFNWTMAIALVGSMLPVLWH